MDDPRELILCDVRCFQDAQRGNLRPITLLVGENSTGTLVSQETRDGHP